MKFTRAVRRLLFERVNEKAAFTIGQQFHTFDRAYFLVRSYYCCNLFFAFSLLADWERWNSVDAIQPLWPIAWINLADVPHAAHYILLFNCLAAFAAMVWSRGGGIPLLACVGLLEAVALKNSFGKIDHGSHAWLWTCFFFVFLPSGSYKNIRSSRIKLQRFLLVFWSAQFAILLFYSMAGVLKLASVPTQFGRGEATVLGPEALSRHIISQFIQSSSSMFGNFFLSHPILSWPLFLCALYIETFAVVAAFRPSLHRFWGLSLILMHITIALSLNAWFTWNILLVALLIFHSPFADQNVSVRRVALSLPLLGWLYGQLLNTSRPYSQSSVEA